MLQLYPVDFPLRLDESLLRFRQAPAKALNRLHGEHRYMLLVIRMEMRQTMLADSLDEHSNDNPEESRQFGHGRYINIVR